MNIPLPNGLLFVVLVNRDGGVDAHRNQPASYTYAIRSLDGEPLGKNLSPVRPRELGSLNEGRFYGLAYMQDQVAYLWDAGETPVVSTCEGDGK